MSPRSRAQLQVIETEQDRAVTRLHHLIRHRETLRGPFRDYWTAISAGADDAELERWAEGALELAFVNAGPDCQLAFWRVSSELKSELSLNELADFARAAADICRGSGAQAALALDDQGLIDAKLSFLRNTSLCEFERGAERWRMLSWDAVPHLSEPEHEPLHSHF